MWAKTKELAGITYRVFRTAGEQYGVDRVNRMSAAVAYRAMFALAPLLLVALALFGVFVGDVEARDELLHMVSRVAGPAVLDALENFLDSLSEQSGAIGLIGFGLLLWTGSSLFLELQNDLNDIFEVPYEQTTGVIGFLVKRGLGFLWSVAIGVILVAVWALNSFWQFVDDFLPASFGSAHAVVSVLAPLISLLVLPFVFALVFQTLTRVSVRWRAIWWGSFFTSAAFLLASYAASLYFSLAKTSAAGIAGAAVVIILLAYILSAVFLFGAEVTKVYNRYLETGSIRPEPPMGPLAVVAEPKPVLPLAAAITFLVGIFVGWRRR